LDLIEGTEEHMTHTCEGGHRIQANGLTFHVVNQRSGPAILLVHGWPDSSHIWRYQIPVLVEAGFRVIAPDLRGFGESDRPEVVEAYAMPMLLSDLKGILATLGIERVRLVGHDWGAAIAWQFATYFPTQVEQLVALAVGHPSAAGSEGLTQWEKHWYFLWFLFPGVAETVLPRNNWAVFRELLQGQGEVEHYIETLARPGALAASLNLYRANIHPMTVGASAPPTAPLSGCPTMGIWGSEDFAMPERQMELSGNYVLGPWHYERLQGVGHWLPDAAPDRVNALLLDFLTPSQGRASGDEKKPSARGSTTVFPTRKDDGPIDRA